MESQVLKPEAYLHFVEIQPRKLCLQLLLVTPHLLQLISQLGLTLSCLLASQIQLRLQPQDGCQLVSLFCLGLNALLLPRT